MHGENFSSIIVEYNQGFDVEKKTYTKAMYVDAQKFEEGGYKYSKSVDGKEYSLTITYGKKSNSVDVTEKYDGKVCYEGTLYK